MSGTQGEMFFILTMQNRVYILSLYLKVFHLKTVAMDYHSQFFKIYIAFNSGILLYYEAKKIPTVKVTANPRRKLEMRDTSLPLHTSHFFQLHVDTISVMDTLVRYYELEILWALKTASLAQLNSQGTFILKFLEQFEGRLTFFHIALPPAKDWTARVSLQIEIH